MQSDGDAFGPCAYEIALPRFMAVTGRLPIGLAMLHVFVTWLKQEEFALKCFWGVPSSVPPSFQWFKKDLTERAFHGA